MANYMRADQRPEIKMPEMRFGFLLPAWKLMAKSPGNTVFAFAMCASITWAATNALYFQKNGHPAPLFNNLSVASEQNVVPIEFVPPQRSTNTAKQISQPIPPAMPSNSFGPVTGNPSAFFVQSKLSELGYFKEKVDGYYGPKTAAAIREFEIKNGLTATGAISNGLVEALSIGRVAVPVPVSTPNADPHSEVDPLLNIAQRAVADTAIEPPEIVASELVAQIQAGLNSLGYDVGKIDGIQGEATSTAIRKFETFYNYDQTGEITHELLDMLKAANAKF